MHTTSKTRLRRHLLRASLPMAALLVLAGCTTLHDTNYAWCDPAPAVVPAPAAPVVEKISLQADALFAFDRSTLADMLPAGRATLDELARTLTTGFAHIDSITLTGHTDRLGSAEYNQKLSQARADTVQRYLQSKGVTAPITTRGAGESQPVTHNCTAGQPRAALVQCLQPDRRVDVEITGLRKGG